MKQTVKDRLIQFIEFKNVSVRKFEQICGLGPTYVAHLPERISNSKLAKIRMAYPDLNPQWLLYGDGDMVFESQETLMEQANRLDAIGAMQQVIESKDALIAGKDEVIATLREAIEIYRKRVAELEARLGS